MQNLDQTNSENRMLTDEELDAVDGAGIFGRIGSFLRGIFGGPGDYTRTAIGAVFITVLITVLVGHGASKAVEFIVYGGIILVAVAIYGRERRLRDRV